MNNALKEPIDCSEQEERVKLAREFFMTRHGYEPLIIKELVHKMQEGAEWVAIYVTPTHSPYLGMAGGGFEGSDGTYIAMNDTSQSRHYFTIHVHPTRDFLNLTFSYLVRSGRYPFAECYYLPLSDFILEYTNVYREVQGDVGSNCEARSNEETEV